VVLCDVPDGATAVGAPARIVFQSDSAVPSAKLSTGFQE